MELTEEGFESYRGFPLLGEQVEALKDLAANPKSRIKTGLPSLDALIEGPAWGEVVTVMARSYVGKSLFATNLMANNLDAGIIFFSLEMPAHQVIQRLYCHTFDMPSSDFHRAMRDNELPETLDWLEDRMRRHVVIDSSGIGFADFSAYIENYETFFGQRPDCVIIDYLEEIDGSKGKAEGWVATQALASRLKAWSRTEHMPVFLLHQTNKQEKSWNPPTEDSANGGGFREADVVVGLFRPGNNPDLMELERQSLKFEMHMNVLKNRITNRTTDGKPLRYRISPSGTLVDLSREQVKSWYRD